MSGDSERDSPTERDLFKEINGFRKQINAYKQLLKNYEGSMQFKVEAGVKHKMLLVEAEIKSLDSEREANSVLTEEIAKLRAELAEYRETKMDSKQGQRNKLGDAITELLRSHRLMHTLGDDDSGLPLVDALTPPGDTSITLGIEEIELMAGELAWLVIPADTSNDSAWCDDCHGYTHKAGNPCADAKALEGEALPKENAILCSADEVDRLRKIEEAAKQIRADYQANRFSHENMMALIEAMRVPNV